MAWQDDGLCKGQPASIFFGATLGSQPDLARALSFCDPCPVQRQCRDYARAHRQYGVWGGETDDQRRRALGLRNRRSMTEHTRQRRSTLAQQALDFDARRTGT